MSTLQSADLHQLPEEQAFYVLNLLRLFLQEGQAMSERIAIEVAVFFLWSLGWLWLGYHLRDIRAWGHKIGYKIGLWMSKS